MIPEHDCLFDLVTGNDIPMKCVNFDWKTIPSRKIKLNPASDTQDLIDMANRKMKCMQKNFTNQFNTLLFTIDWNWKLHESLGKMLDSPIYDFLDRCEFFIKRILEK